MSRRSLPAQPRARARDRIPYDHYSILRTIEDAWHLRELGWSACACTHPMTDLLAP
jgi:hypothetical protein